MGQDLNEILLRLNSGLKIIEEFSNYCQNITQLKIKLWKENTSEGDSLYLLDPDGYKLELHVGNWQTRLAAIRQQPYEDMVFFD